MVYLIMAFGGFFVFFWGLALLFASKTKGERSLGIPAFWIVVFGAVAGFGGLKFSESAANPEALVKDKYMSLGQNEGDKLETIQGIIGVTPIDMKSLDEDELKAYDLTANHIVMPREITGRLAPGVFEAERKDSEVAIEIFPGIEDYEADTGASKRNARNNTFKDNVTMPVLGSSAVLDEKKKQGHGLVGLQVRIFVPDEEKTNALREERKAEADKAKAEAKEAEAKGRKVEEFVQGPLQPVAVEGQEWFITEGEHWTYEDNMTAAQAADALAKAIDTLPEFSAKYELDEDALIPNSNLTVKAKYCLDDTTECPDEKINPLSGDAGNTLRIQVMTGDNDAVRVGNKTNGAVQSFFGGADEVQLVFWEESEPFLDDDFNTTKRLFVAGFLRKGLVAVGQTGLEIENEPLRPEKEDS